MSFEQDHCGIVQADPRGENWTEAARRHAADCPACASFLEGCEELGSRLKGLPSSRESMPADLRAGLLRQLDASSTPDAVPGRRNSRHPLPFSSRFLVPAAMAASLVLGVILGRSFEIGGGLPVEVDKTVGQYIFDVTHDHFLLERIGRPLEVEITDPAELSGWLSASLNFAFHLPESDDDFVLQGGRVWHTVGRLSAMASYATDSGARVVLFAVPAENLSLTEAESYMVGETRVFKGDGWNNEARVWIDGDLAIALTAPEGELPPRWEEVFLP